MGVKKEDDPDPGPDRVCLRKVQPDRSVNVLRSLSNPIRMRLLYGLAQGASLSELEVMLGLTKAELGFHLRTLQVYGLVKPSRLAELTTQGIWLVSFLEEVSEKLTTGEDIETSFTCWSCGKERVQATVYPDHFKLWCPACGGERGRKQILVTGQNQAGSSWQELDLTTLVSEGIREDIDVMLSMFEKVVCRECGAGLNIKEKENRVKAECPYCGEHYQGPTGPQLTEYLNKVYDAVSHSSFTLWFGVVLLRG